LYSNRTLPGFWMKNCPSVRWAVRPDLHEVADQGLQARQISAHPVDQGALGGVEPARGARRRAGLVVAAGPTGARGRGG